MLSADFSHKSIDNSLKVAGPMASTDAKPAAQAAPTKGMELPVSSEIPPFHILMTPPATKQQQQIALAKRRLFDPRLQRDYLAKRHKAYYRHPCATSIDSTAEKSTEINRNGDKSDNDQKQKQPAGPTLASLALSLWDGR